VPCRPEGGLVRTASRGDLLPEHRTTKGREPMEQPELVIFVIAIIIAIAIAWNVEQKNKNKKK